MLFFGCANKNLDLRILTKVCHPSYGRKRRPYDALSDQTMKTFFSLSYNASVNREYKQVEPNPSNGVTHTLRTRQYAAFDGDTYIILLLKHNELTGIRLVRRTVFVLVHYI